MKNFSMRQSTIVRTTLLGFLVTVLPMFILCIIAEFWTIQALQKETQETYSTKLSMTSEVFSDNLETLQSTASKLLLDHDVVSMTAQPRDHMNLYAFADFRDQLQLQFSSSFMNADVIVVFPAQGLAVSSKRGVDKLEKYPGLSDISILEKTPALWSLQPSYRDPQRQTLSVQMGYVRPEQSFPIVIIEIAQEELTRQMENLLLPGVTVQSAFFRDIGGRSFVVGTQQILSDNELDLLAERLRTVKDIEPYYKSSGDIRLRVSPVYLPYLCGVIGVAFDETEILQPIFQTIYLLVALVVFGVLTSAAYLCVVYRKVYYPMHMLTEYMKKVAKGDLTARIQVMGHNEFEVLADQFNHMTQKLSDLMKQTYSLEIELRKAQVRFLRSQINPHFLSNSLFCVYNMIKSCNLDSAADMVVYLGKYYRLGVRLDDLKLPLEQEMENIRLYLKIHQLRMAGNFSFTCEICDGLEEFQVPSLSLQTVVENAVQHAFKKKTGPAQVDVAAYTEPGSVILSVTDNGSGIPREELDAIRFRIDEPEQGDELHGLQNVSNRMRLLFGAGVKFTISLAEPHGTAVVIRIPVPSD